MDALVTAIQDGIAPLTAKIPDLVTAALSVAVLVFGARIGWRLIRSLAGR